MANGGGPACLRLRVVADPGTVDPRFIADEAKLDRIAGVVAKHWPEAIAPGDLASAALASDVRKARRALLAELGLSQLDCFPLKIRALIATAPHPAGADRRTGL